LIFEAFFFDNKMSNGLVDTQDDDIVRRHILDCLGALVNKETYHPSTSPAKSSVFYRSVIAICEAWLRRADEDYSTDDGVMLLLRGNFPTPSKAKTKSKMELEAAIRGDWMPALWVGMIGNVGKKTVCELLHSEPVLKAPKKNGDEWCATTLHYAAAAYQPNLDAIDAISSPHSMRARDGDGKLPLHWAAQYSRSLPMIQYLIQSCPSAIRMTDCDSRFPIEYLTKREPFAEKLDMIRVFGEAAGVETSSPTKGANRFGCNDLCTYFGNKPPQDFLEVGQVLINLHPKDVFARDTFKRLPLHWLCRNSHKDACILAEKLIAIYPESVKVEDGCGQLPAHSAAANGSLMLLKLLLEKHSDGIDVPSLMHSAACNDGPDAVAIIRFIAGLDPTSVTKKDDYGRLPIHNACAEGSLGAFTALYEYYPQGIYEVDEQGDLPIHRLLLTDYYDTLKEKSSSRSADILQLLLRYYPDSAFVENREMVANDEVDGENEEEDEEEEERPAEVERRRTPYAIAVDSNMTDYVRRLILRAAPSCDPQKLRKLNYAARRMAMFLAFSAVTSDPSPGAIVHILRGLMAGHGNDMPLLKHVISFL
jgi:ankyrin repeat protein